MPVSSLATNYKDCWGRGGGLLINRPLKREECLQLYIPLSPLARALFTKPFLFKTDQFMFEHTFYISSRINIVKR